MLSRKLVGWVSAGLLSVALIPATWARTHSHPVTKTSATTTKKLVAQPTKHKQLAAKKTIATKTVAKKPLSHKTSSRHLVHSKATAKKLATKKPIVHRSTKLTAKKQAVIKNVKLSKSGK